MPVEATSSVLAPTTCAEVKAVAGAEHAEEAAVGDSRAGAERGGDAEEAAGAARDCSDGKCASAARGGSGTECGNHGDLLIDQPIEGSDGTVPLVVDRTSVPLLTGSTIGYTDTIEKQGFKIDNPNAGGGCACGNSFCG